MIGSKGRWAVGMAAAAALLAGSVAPAAARGYGPGWGAGGWGGGGWRPHHRDRGLNAGDVIGIAALIGAVAVIASSAAKDKASRSTSADVDTYPDDRRYDDGSYSRNEDYDRADPAASYPGPAMSANAAADACAVAVRDKVESEQGGYAHVLNVGEPRASGPDGWAIDGQVERRSSVRGAGGEVRRFSCDIAGNRVAEVYISRDRG